MPTNPSPRLLDGAIGTELILRGVPSAGPAWTGSANLTHPEVVAALHAAYAAAGATVHTANTFRTRPADMPDAWRDALHAAVTLCRQSVPATHVVFGSLSPQDDCYAPHTPAEDTRADHARVATALVEAGVDGIVCETFLRADEAWVATEEAVSAGATTWTALCPGIDADRMTPAQLRYAAQGALERGATRVLVNCVDARRVLPYLTALSDLPSGVYANAGPHHGGVGWGAEGGPQAYAALARQWVASGASVVGGCCGTGPAHIAAVFHDAAPRYVDAPETP